MQFLQYNKAIKLSVDFGVSDSRVRPFFKIFEAQPSTCRAVNSDDVFSRHVDCW